MKKIMFKAWVMLVAVILMPPLTYAEKTTHSLRVVTTVPPITNIVKNIAGTSATVTGIVPNGIDSHTFEPVPTDAKILARADLIFVNGLDLEIPTIQLAEKVKHADTPIVRLANETLPEEKWQYDFSFPKEHGHPNPHLWPNIALTIRYAEIIRDRLIAVSDPEHTIQIAANAATYIEKLEQLDQAIFTCIHTIPENNRKLITYHDSFAYFAPRYGMEIIAAVQPASFTEPGPRDVINLIKQIRAEKIPAIFGSEVFPSKTMEQIARESGTQFVDQLSDDELPEKPHRSFIGMMVNNISVMAGALGGDMNCASHIDASNLFETG